MSGTTAQPPSAPSGAKEELGCYSGLYSANAVVARPTSIASLKESLAKARASGRCVTLRAGGHSFDGQALGDEEVISLLGLDEVEVFPEKQEMEVGAGATWGKILEALEPYGLVPAVTVTTERATAGGTLSGNCLSRFSPAHGKEGEQILRFVLLTADGEEITCTPPEEGADFDQMTREEKLFCGAIGGLGYLGVVVRITYRVLRAGREGERIGIDTSAVRAKDFEDLGRRLIPPLRRMYLEDSDPTNPDMNDSFWSALGTQRDGSMAALIFTSRFTTDPGRRRMVLHRPKFILRIPFEWLMRIPAFAKFAWRLFMWTYRKKRCYTDDLHGFSFFMDGNARAKRVGKVFGFKMMNAQQTFVVPADIEAGDEAKDRLIRWLQHAHDYLVERDLAPTLHDVLFLPADDLFLLSATAGMPGFAVSYAFETSNKDRIDRVMEAFRELSDDLWRDYQGRVYLVKNVFASTETLERMYGRNLTDFRALKAEVDPDEMFVDEFYRRAIDPTARPRRPSGGLDDQD